MPFFIFMASYGPYLSSSKLLKVISFLLLCLVFNGSVAQQHHQRWSEINIRHYKFQLELSDTTNDIKGNAEVTIKFKKPINEVVLDLVSQTDAGGMLVSQVLYNDQQVNFEHTGTLLTIALPEKAQIKSEGTFSIAYSGVPIDGLVISENLHGNRTFFGDNWPDRAQNWLPVVDHPSDKASVEFIVIAPGHYQIISNGIQIEETNLSNGLKFTHWKEDVELPTKVMVIGVSGFATQLVGEVDGIPVYTWVYPEDRIAGFYDYSIAPEILKYMVEMVGVYPYHKLANVQSTTRFGGMENANTIFYDEKLITGTRELEATVAHEIAHQWFGNSTSEADWHHAWLSEGFATYFENFWFLYSERENEFRKKMIEDRLEVIEYSKIRLAPIVDTSVVDYVNLLNSNTYEKAAWVLHMLRHKIGEEAYFQGIRQYYDEYKFSNALTEDFQEVMGAVSGVSLKRFFEQWFFRAGHPIISKSFTQKNSKLSVEIEQKQSKKFEFLLEIEIEVESGLKILKLVQAKRKRETFEFEIESKVVGVNLDPNLNLLYEDFN